MAELQWSFRINWCSAIQKIKARWQEYCQGEIGVGKHCRVVLIWFVLLKLRLFLPILKYLQKRRALAIYHLHWKFPRLLRVTSSSHAGAIKGKRGRNRMINAPKSINKAQKNIIIFITWPQSTNKILPNHKQPWAPGLPDGINARAPLYPLSFSLTVHQYLHFKISLSKTLT